MDSHLDFQFQVDSDVQKHVTVEQTGRQLDVTVRFSNDVVLDTTAAHIEDVVDWKIRTDEQGLTIEWKTPVIAGLDWLTSAKQRRF